MTALDRHLTGGEERQDITRRAAHLLLADHRCELRGLIPFADSREVERKLTDRAPLVRTVPDLPGECERAAIVIERLEVAVAVTQEIREVEMRADRGCREVVVNAKFQRVRKEGHRLLGVPALHREHGLDVQCL